MKLEQFQREKEYGAAIAIAGALLANGQITDDEYYKVKTVLIKKYRPVIGLLQDGRAPRKG